MFKSVSEISKEMGIPKRTIYETVHWYLAHCTKNEMLLLTAGGGKYIIDPVVLTRVMEQRTRFLLRH